MRQFAGRSSLRRLEIAVAWRSRGTAYRQRLPMEYRPFIATVEDYAGIDREEAERAVHATLATLAERLAGGEVRDLAAQLPGELRPFLEGAEPAEAFGVDEFLRRIAQREGVPVPTAARHARAVFTALGRAVGHKELKDMASQLRTDFREFIEAANPATAHLQPPPPDELPADDFVESTADRLGAGRDTAWHAIDAVLEMLARRISHGEVDDLAVSLPAAVAGPLEYGIIASGDNARPIPVEEFVRGIVEREGVTPREAIEHTRAVFATLREFVGDKELSDVFAQLPKDYDVLQPREDEPEAAVEVQVVELVELVEYVRP